MGFSYKILGHGKTLRIRKFGTSVVKEHNRLTATYDTLMERLDQGHLHPKLEVPEPGSPRWEASTPEKSHSNTIIQ
jgi:hypothetical protein